MPLMRRPAAEPLLIFHHIPKTAGRSLREIILANYRHSEMAESYGAPASTEWYRLWWRSFPAEERADLRCVVGHTANALLPVADRPCRVLCVVRHPVERVLSLHAFLRAAHERTAASLPGWAGDEAAAGAALTRTGASLEDIYREDGNDALRLPQFFDGQVRNLLPGHPDLRLPDPRPGEPADAGRATLEELLRRMHEVYLVGVQDRLRESVERFAAALSWRVIPIPTRNVTGDRRRVGELSPKVHERILLHNQLDLALYEHFAARLGSSADSRPRIPRRPGRLRRQAGPPQGPGGRVTNLARVPPALRRRLRLSPPSRASAPMDQDRLVWIFGYARSGSSWLARMMTEPAGWTFWDEPQVGEMLGTFYYLRYRHRRDPSFLLGDAHRDVWEAGIRSLVLEGARARHGNAEYVVIKEPHGSIGAPLLSRSLPQSRMVLLIRDPRDMVASALDGQRRDGWASEKLRRRGLERATKADTDPDGFVRARSTQLMEHVGRAQEAYDNHPGPKSFVTYEQLAGDPLEALSGVLRGLRVDVPEQSIREAVDRQHWDRIPPEKRGPRKKFRKATPGGWRDDLTAEQASIVEEIAAPLLERHYREP